MRKYHVYGLGNALVDRETPVSDELMASLGVEKGVMTLTDAARHLELSQALADAVCHRGCGGSAANTMIALAQFGGRGFYSCKVANDESGQLFLQELRDLGIDSNLDKNNLPEGITGECLVLVTEDAQRTMNTHLGITATLCPKVIDHAALANSNYLYLEGYLIATETGRETLIEARKSARESGTKVALSLSDPNMVRFFRNELLTVIDDKIDLIFCNEEEARLFTQSESLEMALAMLQSLARHLVITCGPKGALLAIDGEVMAIPTTETQAIDTIGAGDMFAGAYLYAITQGFAPPLAAELANKSATALVGQYGARLSQQRLWTIKDQFMTTNYHFSQSLYAKLSREEDLVAF